MHESIFLNKEFLKYVLPRRDDESIFLDEEFLEYARSRGDDEYNYIDNASCAIAQFLKHKLPSTDTVNVFIHSCVINGKAYEFPSLSAIAVYTASEPYNNNGSDVGKFSDIVRIMEHPDTPSIIRKNDFIDATRILLELLEQEDA